MLRLSQSKVNTWLYCPAAFFEQYILGLEVYNPDFDLGTNYHKQVELYHLGGPYEADTIKHYTGACDCTGKLAHPTYAPDFFGSPALVEQRYIHTFTHPVTGKALRLPFSMVLDGIREHVELRDLKTSKSAYNQKLVDASLQATVYIYAWWQMTGELLPFTFTVVRKNPGPRTKAIEEWTTTRTIEDFARFHEETAQVIYEIQTATSYPCRCRDQRHAMKGVNA